MPASHTKKSQSCFLSWFQPMFCLLLSEGSTPRAAATTVRGRGRVEPGQMPDVNQGLLHSTWQHMEGHNAVGSWLGRATTQGCRVGAGGCRVGAVNWSASNCIAAMYVVITTFLFLFSSCVLVNCFYLSPRLLFCFQFSPPPHGGEWTEMAVWWWAAAKLHTPHFHS